MYPLQEPFKSDALAQLNSRMLQAGRIAGNLLEISHQIGVLNVRTGKASAEALGGAVQKLLAANNPVEFLQLAATVMRPVPQVWTEYAAQLRDIAGRMVAPVTQGLAEAATESSAASVAPAAIAAPAAAPAPLDLQGVLPPSAMETAVQEPPLPVDALVQAAPEVKVPARPAEAATAPSQAAAAPEVPQAVQEVAEAINHVAKSAPVIPATPAANGKNLPKAAVVPKAAVKASRPQAMQKGAPTGKSAGRSRKS